MDNAVVLSIHPEFSQKILSGEKTWEFRKKIWKRIKDVKYIYIYETAPTSMVVGCITEFRIHVNHPYILSVMAGKGAGIDIHRFDEYFGTLPVGYGIEILKIEQYEPFNLAVLTGGNVPQNFLYCNHIDPQFLFTI